MLIIYIGTGSFYVYTYEHFHTEDTNINKESFLSQIENMFLCYNSGYDIIFIGAVPRFLREVISMVTYTELFAYTLVLAAVITLVVKIKK